jgi:dienelactone hydrolase
VPNWRNVVTPIVDYLQSRPDVDTSRIALVGDSFSRILAPRAATKEHGLTAYLAIGGTCNLAPGVLSQVLASTATLYNTTNVTAFDAIMSYIRGKARTSPPT